MARARTSHFTYILAFASLVAFAAPADAVTFAKFYSGGVGYTGPFSGPGTVYDATKGLVTDCPTGGCPGGDVVGDPLAFPGLGITGTASPGSVWDDLSPNFGGLGVGTGDPSDTDQIAGSDVLTLAFSSTVNLSGIGTLFATAHTPFGTGFETVTDVAAAVGSIAFEVSVNGGAFASVAFALANSMGLDLEGSTFAFRQLSGNPQFYISALAYEVCGPVGAPCAEEPPPIPIPGALPLFLTGLGLVGLLARRRGKLARA
jgi:hypothetical protein